MKNLETEPEAFVKKLTEGIYQIDLAIKILRIGLIKNAEEDKERMEKDNLGEKGKNDKKRQE
jgi:hypothetical protein